MNEAAPNGALSDLNPVEREFYARFRDAYEAHGTHLWKLEGAAIELCEAGGDNTRRTAIETLQKKELQLLAQRLADIQVLVKEAMSRLGGTERFGSERVGVDGLANTIQRRIERDVLETGMETAHPAILKNAMLEAFVDREKKTRSSVYKKRVRVGFKESAEAIIKREGEQNAAWREELLRKNAGRLTEDDRHLIELVFRRRMARHGMETPV